MLERYTNRLIASQMRKRGLETGRLDEALTRAVCALEGCQFELGHRILLNAVFSYRPQGKLLDLGGGCSLYHLILKNLGMDVSVVDLFFDQEMKSRFEGLGIKVIQQNIYDFEAPAGSCDVISSFECFEHLPHSPKQIVDKMVAALKPGGHFVMSIPNVVRFDQRLRVLAGQTPHEKYGPFYHSGDYFIGHHREMTTKEVRWLLAEAGLAMEELFTTDMTVQSMKQRSALKVAMQRLNYRWLLTDAFMPPNLRKHIWARGVKAA